MDRLGGFHISSAYAAPGVGRQKHGLPPALQRIALHCIASDLALPYLLSTSPSRNRASTCLHPANSSHPWRRPTFREIGPQYVSIESKHVDCSGGRQRDAACKQPNGYHARPSHSASDEIIYGPGPRLSAENDADAQAEKLVPDAAIHPHMRRFD